MLLAIDVGNTNTLFALHDGEGFRAQWRISTDGRRTADEYYVWLRNLMALEGVDPEAVTDAILAQVAPQTLFNLRSLCRKYFKVEPLVVGEPGCALGIEVRMPNPGEVGADRLVNVAAGLRDYGPNLIIIDFGTATTFDVCDEDGAYAGGAISPGINLSLEALHQAAAKLPRIDVARPARVIGKGTVDAMRSGVYWGYVGLIEGLCDRIEAEHGRPMTVIATGGLAPLFSKATPRIDHGDPDLTMRGLAYIHALNRAKPPGDA
ncbi:type III pantothenate kinase [Neomegalonema perideroedes]|uniref:type III pantothenate kinase n=1 Tax=Neomegalonema perideroedes TaxID=217219 RepID=UPI0003701963|nr:type III pantothenate kinase [Neomegalonema perideroedes]